MEILIKSFNRAFYLDRNISSVYENVSGNFKITVLDDGTPEKYLAKIKEKYPEINIVTSKNYAEKIKAIAENLETGKEINGFQIPTDLWIEAAKNASNYFLMTEDDVWFTQKIDLDELTSECKKLDINLLKFGWLGNIEDDKYLEIKEISQKINATVPKDLFLKNKKIMEAFFYNKFKFFSFLYKIGKVDHITQRKYWALNSILMGFYKKEYWLEIWKNMETKVDEKRQLINASVYYKKNKKNKNFISRLKSEAMKTTFQSSATNSYHQYGNDFDVNLFNHLINEAWFNGDFNSLENYPKDFSIDYFSKFLDKKVNEVEFRNWAENFKNQYRNIDCQVD